MTGHVTAPAAALAEALPGWVTLLRAPNPGPMTLDGTNTWVLRAAAGEPAVVVDPGPLDEGHLAAIAAQAPVGLVLITHGHHDHTEGVPRLRELLDGVPVLAADPAHTNGGSPLTTPGARLGGFGFGIDLVVTPGHTADSVCFLVRPVGDPAPAPARDVRPTPSTPDVALFSGDTILGRGTTVVAHPDGDLGAYLASLELLGGYDGVPVLPGHGPALADCAAAARFYLAHRLARLDQVRQAVAGGARTPEQVVEVVYADVDRSLWWAAGWSVRAQLDYLERGGRESAEPARGLDTA
ncbi:MBL fold metallo-hydrolase [Plantactinospora sp. KBS50]|uniref:MBL fold metallo-hydrolase n=1 Tax=Plantactinospora sp. KBS50 TaxID=2024580 RepID=UPI000BAAA9A5|nr:MBL fold metallo-hydrolase [Plantactinospora sp. KBS50]ASW57050.1 MBL fold metallo-hydrolase [Plantactinospora sp. KBS50]